MSGPLGFAMIIRWGMPPIITTSARRALRHAPAPDHEHKSGQERHRPLHPMRKDLPKPTLCPSLGVPASRTFDESTPKKLQRSLGILNNLIQKSCILARSLTSSFQRWRQRANGCSSSIRYFIASKAFDTDLLSLPTSEFTGSENSSRGTPGAALRSFFVLARNGPHGGHSTLAKRVHIVLPHLPCLHQTRLAQLRQLPRDRSFSLA